MIYKEALVDEYLARIIKAWNHHCKVSDDCCNCELEDVCNDACSALYRIADYIPVKGKEEKCVDTELKIEIDATVQTYDELTRLIEYIAEKQKEHSCNCTLLVKNVNGIH